MSDADEKNLFHTFSIKYLYILFFDKRKMAEQYIDVFVEWKFSKLAGYKRNES